MPYIKTFLFYESVFTKAKLYPNFMSKGSLMANTEEYPRGKTWYYYNII